MELKIINSKNFDTSFGNLLQTKKAQNVVKGRFDIEHLGLNAKIDFIFHILASSSPVLCLTYKILFWEKDNIIEDLNKANKEKIFQIVTSYKDREAPGVFFIDEEKIDKSFLNTLLVNHFNYEMAQSPSLNIRVQISVNHEDHTVLLDVYDDRGFDVYYLGNS